MLKKVLLAKVKELTDADQATADKLLEVQALYQDEANRLDIDRADLKELAADLRALADRIDPPPQAVVPLDQEDVSVVTVTEEATEAPLPAGAEIVLPDANPEETLATEVDLPATLVVAGTEQAVLEPSSSPVPEMAVTKPVTVIDPPAEPSSMSASSSSRRSMEPSAEVAAETSTDAPVAAIDSSSAAAKTEDVEQNPTQSGS